MNDVTVTEGTGGAMSAKFAVSLSASPTETVTVGDEPRTDAAGARGLHRRSGTLPSASA